MKCLATLSLLTALGKAVAVPSIPAPDSYNLTLVLGGEGDAQYWELTEENMPPGISSTEFMFTALSNSRRGLDKRGSIECSDSHQSGTADCVSLINALFRDLSGIPTSPRNIRYNNCYVSWSAVVSGVRGDLYPAAVDVFNKCNKNNLISGLERDVNIGDKGVTECLSNRATGCN